ncbi:hypothetical protein PHMEG_00040468 [Phytophthora megakarya]|uniref:Eukaryotic/viral aspartic protease n=1 Tax=Phytophthora megakarya TaxID=4795 RepID=A0A225UDR9_9STRA|nr:hypothetical protein PHMEG_00040468 [Phytophthora megakarya]
MATKTKITPDLAGLKSTYHHKELRDFVDQDSVMRILKLKQFSDPKDPVTAPATLANKLDPTMELIRLVREAGMIPGSFDADTLFDLDLDVIQATSRDLFQKLKTLVGEVPQSPDPLPLTTTDVVDNLTVSSHLRQPQKMDLTPPRSHRDECPSDLLGHQCWRRDPRSAALVQPETVAAITDPHQRIRPRSPRAQTDQSKFFNAAMDRYLAEEREANKDPASTRLEHQGSQDVEMESIRSSDQGSRWEFPTSAQATVATGAAMIQRVRISAISEFKEFSGKDQDEDRTRAWISKVKSAFMRDQASDDEKCLTFADLLAGSAKNWYHQLSRSTHNKWSELLRSFQI